MFYIHNNGTQVSSARTRLKLHVKRLCFIQQSEHCTIILQLHSHTLSVPSTVIFINLLMIGDVTLRNYRHSHAQKVTGSF